MDDSSKILTYSDQEFFASLFPGKTVSLKLLYRGSRDGFGASAFHGKANSQGATVSFMKSATYGKTFGGYTSKQWTNA